MVLKMAKGQREAAPDFYKRPAANYQDCREKSYSSKKSTEHILGQSALLSGTVQLSSKDGLSSSNISSARLTCKVLVLQVVPISKLESTTISANVCRIVNSDTDITLFDRPLRIAVGSGVKQGDPISPKLFTACLEHVFRQLNWDNTGIYQNGRDWIKNVHSRIFYQAVLQFKLQRHFYTFLQKLLIALESIPLASLNYCSNTDKPDVHHLLTNPPDQRTISMDPIENLFWVQISPLDI
ncbi:hypothetical protein EOD39_7753 [Acipenser ruthenus]|uniref:Reverse transcriptase domain-containing protein n=1 Tax=Acipenser ruthenus TaxID=7906 RepID=A0A444U601_ACIRT|nr:hypothetical protein EOD39_7753 [Acipenser ruthenus]